MNDRIPSRVLAGFVLGLLLTGCAGQGLESLAPRVFYGFASSGGQGLLCVLDARDDEPTRERCFAVDQAAIADQQLQRFDLVKITYEPAEQEGAPARATRVVEVNPGP